MSGAGEGAARLVDLARAALEGARVIAVGIGPAPIPGLEPLGADVRGRIAVMPAGAGSKPGDDPRLLWLRGRERDIFAHVVHGLARALDDARAEVSAFLDRVDPRAEATVLAYLPVPVDIFGRRRVLAQDAARSRVLEDKRSPALAEGLPAPRRLRLPWPCDPAGWEAIAAELGATRLVVQAMRLAGGGLGTRIVDGYAEAKAHLGELEGELQAAAFLAGDPCNVMGLVPIDGPTIALPASLQVIAEERRGRPVYAGNRLDERDFTEGERAAIAEEIRAFGERLRGRGFHGPFGVDFIRDPGGRRCYHDLNPRMNGAVGLLDELVGEALAAPSPLLPLLLGRGHFTRDEARRVEVEVDAARRGRPRWRLFLSTRAREPRSVVRAPRAGLWAIDPPTLGVAWVAAEGPLASGIGRLRPALVAGAQLLAGDRVVVGDLSCGPELGHALLACHGPAAPDLLARALMRAAEGA